MWPGYGTANCGSSSVQRNPRVLALLDNKQPNTVDYYRIQQGYDVLRARGYPVCYMPYGVARQFVAGGLIEPDEFDVFVLCRASVGSVDKRLLDFIEIMHQARKKLIYETDDDYTNEHRRTIEGDAISVAKLCDAITTTTPYLASRLRQYNQRVYVLPNAINPVVWDEVKRHDDEGVVTIALAGTGTHLEDYRLVADALFEVRKRYGDAVRFLILGYKPYYLEDLSGVDFVPFKPYEEYVHQLGRVDIGLCPLVPDDPFNLCKSPVKALEYMAAGAAVIAQDMPVYRAVVNNRHNGLLSTDDWLEQIVLLLEEPNLRQRIGRKGRNWVYRNFNIHTLAIKWWRVYEGVYRK